jgi:hypothetical protein
MTEPPRVTVIDPRAPVHNGPGAQNIYYGAAGPDWMRRKGVEPLRIARADRLRLDERFVAPPGYRDAADRLAAPGSVVALTGAPGSGRRAAAVMLLHRIGTEDGTSERDPDTAEGIRCEELTVPVPGPDRDEDDAFLPPGPGDRFLFDLSGTTDEEAYRAARFVVATRRSQVQENGAHLVVVLPSGLAHAHDPDLEPYTVALGRPRGVAVVTRHLRMDGMPFTASDLAGDDVRRLCARSPMRELARFTGLVRAARDSGRFGSDFAGWLAQAAQAVGDRTDDVRAQVNRAGTAPERALLLAAAMFEGAGADTVHEAWQGLMRTVRHDPEPVPELAQTDFGVRLKELAIERDRDGRLRFTSLAYADAVRTYFWTNFPGSRAAFGAWIGQAAGLPGLTNDDRVNVAVRFGEQALTAGRPEQLFELVAHWADAAAGAARDPRAVAALELGLSHEKFGSWFRRQIYDHAWSGPLPDGLARVLTLVCRRSLSATHPDQAVVRLHHLAVRRGSAAAEAREALLDLVRRDTRLYRLLVDRLRGRTDRAQRTAEPHLHLLTELLRSDRAPDPPPWPDLFLGWEAVFAQPPTPLWRPLVAGWLDAAAADDSREMALDVMVGATHGRAAALHRLYAVACAWAEADRDPSRAAVAIRFWQHIDDAQYARTARAGTGPRTTEEETR